MAISFAMKNPVVFPPSNYIHDNIVEKVSAANPGDYEGFPSNLREASGNRLPKS
jgi:hypothetical protein